MISILSRPCPFYKHTYLKNEVSHILLFCDFRHCQIRLVYIILELNMWIMYVCIKPYNLTIIFFFFSPSIVGQLQILPNIQWKIVLMLEDNLLMIKLNAKRQHQLWDSPIDMTCPTSMFQKVVIRIIEIPRMCFGTLMKLVVGPLV